MRLIVPACLLAVLAAGCAQDPCGWGEGDHSVPTESHLAVYGDAVVVVDAPILGASYQPDPDDERHRLRRAAAVVREVVYLDERFADLAGDDVPVAGSAVAISFNDRCPPAESRVGDPGDTMLLFLRWTGLIDFHLDYPSPWVVAAEFVLDPDGSIRFVGQIGHGYYLDPVIARVTRDPELAPLEALAAWIAETRGAPDFDPRLPTTTTVPGG